MPCHFCRFAHVRNGLWLMVWTRWRRRASAGIGILFVTEYFALFCPLGTAENALHRLPVYGGRCVGIPDPPAIFVQSPGMPTRIARHLTLRRRWPQAL